MSRAIAIARLVRGLIVLGLGVAGVLLASAGAPAQVADKGPLSRYFPREGLVVYAEFDGVDRHAEAWKKTAAYKLLNETTTGAMLEDLAKQLLERATPGAPEGTLKGPEFLTLAKEGLRKGFAFGINKRTGEPKPDIVGLVIRGAGQGEVRRIVDRVIASNNTPATKSQEVAKPGGRKLHIIGDTDETSLTWWQEGDDLVFSLVSPKGADAMIAAIDGDRPNATEQPLRAELARKENGFEPVGLAFFDISVLPPLPPQAVALGLDKVKRIDYRWGFQDDALMTVTRVAVPAPRSGVFATLDQPAFRPKDLPPLPEGQTSFTVFSLEPDRFLGQVRDAAAKSSPGGEQAIDQLTMMVERATGRRLGDEILKPLGPRFAFYVEPSKINAPTNAIAGLAQGFVHVAKSSLIVEVKDAAAYGKILDDIIAGANKAFKTRGGQGEGGPAAEFEPLRGKGSAKGYVLSVPPAVAPLPAGMRPTVLLGKKTLVISSTPDAARRALALEDRPAAAPGAAVARALERLPERVTFLGVSDTRESMLPEVIANLPSLVQTVGSGSLANLNLPFRPRPFQRPPGINNNFQIKIDADEIPDPEDLRAFLFPSTFAMAADGQGFQFVSRESFPTLNPTTAAPIAVALLLPAVQSARSAARRAQSVNNLKQIALAMHNFHSSNGRFPPAASRDKNGNALLSWRVTILPFVEQQALFNEFHMDEPWDSPHNKTLLDKMPMLYAVPGASAGVGMTFYRGFSGKGAFFDPGVPDGIGIANVTDGTSNSIGIIEAKDAVPWTKPDEEIPFDADGKIEEVGSALLSKAGAHFPGGFNAMFLDGSVRFIKHSISPMVMRALVTIAGGEVISSDSF